jgi:hypothetical protein
MDAVDCEAGWDSIELIAAGLSGIVSCYLDVHGLV